MNEKIREILIFTLDTIQSTATNVPLDWRHSGAVARIGVAFNLLSHKGELNKGATLYYRDQWGYFHPSKDRLIPPTEEELRDYSKINEKIGKLNAEKKETV